MRIVIGVHHFPPKYRGGAEWRAYRTASALLKAGHEVLVVCIEKIDDAHAKPFAFKEEAFEGVPLQRLAFDLAAAPDPLQWEYNNAWVGMHLRDLFGSSNTDVFHLMSGYLMTGSALTAARQAGIATVVTLTDFWFLCRRVSMLRTDGTLSTPPIDALRCARCLGEEKRRYRLAARFVPDIMNRYWKTHGRYVDYFEQRWSFLRNCLAETDLAICPSKFLRQMYIDSGMVARRMEFLRQGHNFGSLQATDLHKSPSASLRVGYLGQIAPLKGVQVLVDAVRQLPGRPFELHIHGDSELHPQYAQTLSETARHDPRIVFHGAYGRDQLTAILRELDVIVVPSLWYENSPNVILESFAHATPVIASDFGGMAELVEHGSNGLCFTVGDANALAHQLQRLVDDPGLLASLVDGARQTRTTTLEAEMSQLISYYQSLLAPAGKGTGHHGSATEVDRRGDIVSNS